MGTLKHETAVGLFWNLIERIFSKCLQFFFSLLIARLLMPSDYGIIAIANVVIMLSDILVDSGFSKALINKQNRTDDDYNTIFCFNLCSAFFLYVLIFCISPSIERFYAIDSLSAVIRIQSLVLILNALGGVQYLHLVISMNFRMKAWIEMPCCVISGIAGLYLAYQGAGVWALVVQTVGSGVIRLIGLWIVVHWVPKFKFCIKTAREFFSFGVKVLISDYLGRMYSSLFSIVIGKRFSSSTLGLYGKAAAFSDISFTFISGPISQVTYPALSRIQKDTEKMTSNFYDMLEILAYVSSPIMFGLISVSDPLVRTLLTDNWSGMIPMLNIFAFSSFLSTISSIPSNYLYVMGYSGKSLKIRIISSVIGLILFLIFCRLSVIWVCTGIAIVSLITILLQLHYLKPYIGISFFQCVNKVAPSFILSFFMLVFVIVIMRCFDSSVLKLIFGIVSGFIFYSGISILFQMSGYRQFMSILKLLK